MTKPPLTAVAGLAGRELDAAVHEFVMELGECEQMRSGEWTSYELGRHTTTLPYFVFPDYSTSEGPSFFAMLKAVRERGWFVNAYEMQDPNLPRDNCRYWVVKLVKGLGRGDPDAKEERVIDVDGDTLPLALARAALLTMYPTEDHTP